MNRDILHYSSYSDAVFPAWASQMASVTSGRLPVVMPADQSTSGGLQAPKFYPADDIKKPLRRRGAPKAAKLRASITPGTVVILLAGRFKGKRAIFLKQLPSGLLLVTGPFVVNGVSFRPVRHCWHASAAGIEREQWLVCNNSSDATMAMQPQQELHLDGTTAQAAHQHYLVDISKDSSMQLAVAMALHQRLVAIWEYGQYCWCSRIIQQSLYIPSWRRAACESTLTLCRCR